MILDASDEEIRHGYCFRDVRRLAGYAAHYSYWQRAMPAQDRFDLAVSAIAEFVLTAAERPGEKDLVTAGVQAINRTIAARMRQEGTDYHKPVDGQGPNMANFCTYWWPYAGHVGSHENDIVETIALSQILPRLKPAHRDVIVALAVHGTYDKAAASLGRPRSTFVSYLWAARKEFLRLWHEGERPSRIWGHDFFGIEGYARDETITVRTLHQRKRKKKAKAMDIRATPDQQLIYLNTHWGRRYEFTAPVTPGGTWAATDKFGDHDRLEAASAPELLEAVRNHHQRNYGLPRRQT